ncbi:MAG: exopolyphosphatase, partial [Pseudomonadota bacterium]
FHPARLIKAQRMNIPMPRIAAIDLGSNSFHMVVAQVQQGELKILETASEKVQLAQNLADQHRLKPEAIERAIACLSKFEQHLRGVERANIRIVGTNALRMAKNAKSFIQQASKLLGVPVEVISGREEARLIYLGVAHTLADDGAPRLVIDIGGGSTEVILGRQFEPLVTESLHMGCVSYRDLFFADGSITKKSFQKAVTAARQELLSVEHEYKHVNWSEVVGASGTMRAVSQVLHQMGNEGGTIERKALEKLCQIVIEAGHVDALSLPGLKAERSGILPSGLAILWALFAQFDIQTLRYSDGALREGVLYDQLGRTQHEDVRDRTILALMERYHVDVEHANQVMTTAISLYHQDLNENPFKQPSTEQQHNAIDWLRRAALVHEIGLAISHTQFHKHGAYLLHHSDLSGFSRQEQLILAILVHNHRRKLSLNLLEDTLEEFRDTIMHLIVLLRIAVVLHHSRSIEMPEQLSIKITNQKIRLTLPTDWLEQHPLTQADLEQEMNFLQKGGFQLHIVNI